MIELKEHEFVSEPVIVELSAVSVVQLPMIEKLTESSTIKPALSAFIRALIEVANEKGEIREGSGCYLIGREDIKNQLIKSRRGASNPVVSKHLAALRELGVCEFEVYSQPGRSRINHYLLDNFQSLANHIVEVPDKSESKPKGRTRYSRELIEKERKLLAQDSEAVLLSAPKDMVAFTDRLFNGVLDMAMRVSSKDKRTSITITSTIAGWPLTVTSACPSTDGKKIALLTDQRAMRCIISYCKKEISDRKARLEDKYGPGFDIRSMIPNKFHIDIHDLCISMALEPKGANLTSVESMMTRLSDTMFEIDASENPWFKEQFSSLFKNDADGKRIHSDLFKVSFLTGFEVARENVRISDLFNDDIENLRARFYTFSLEERLFMGLVQSTMDKDSANSYLFRSHEGLVTEQSGILHRFYNWCRAYIGGSPRQVEHKWFTLEELKEHVLPDYRTDNFRAYLMRGLIKKAEDQDRYFKKGKEGTALIYGYLVSYKHSRKGSLFNIKRDPGDLYVGDNSIHNIKIRKEKQQLLDLNSTTDYQPPLLPPNTGDDL